MPPSPRKTNPALDAHIGSRIKLRRTLLGMSQGTLAEAISLTFQQVQKYENGSNRVSASMLLTLSEVLDVPVSFFFSGWGDDAAQCPGRIDAADGPGNRALMEIARLYNAMSSDQRSALLSVAKAITQPAKVAA